MVVIGQEAKRLLQDLAPEPRSQKFKPPSSTWCGSLQMKITLLRGLLL